MKFSLPKIRIDWPNHTIGFFSALFGILVAFELEEWRERKNQEELTSNAFYRLMMEIEFNQNSLHVNVNESLNSIKVLQELLGRVNEQFMFMGTRQDVDSINISFPNLITIDTTASSRFPAHFHMGSITTIPQHSSAWESAKASGVLNYMSYEKVFSLTSIYNYQAITAELQHIAQLTKEAGNLTSRSQLTEFLGQLKESLLVIKRSTDDYDQFISILRAAE
jgi:hypothetical protein